MSLNRFTVKGEIPRLGRGGVTAYPSDPPTAFGPDDGNRGEPTVG